MHVPNKMSSKTNRGNKKKKEHGVIRKNKNEKKIVIGVVATQVVHESARERVSESYGSQCNRAKNAVVLIS